MTLTNRLRGFFTRPRARVREELTKPGELVASNIRKAKPTGEEPKKKDREWLEKFYYMEPLLFSGINFFVHQVVGPGFEIQAKSEKERVLCQSFADKIDLQSLLEKVQLDLGIFGNSFTEKLKDANGGLAGAVGIDTKSMQFMKNLENKLLLNDLGQPIGYIQEHPLESDKESYDEILTRSGVDPKKGNYVGGIPFGKEEIVHFRLYSLSDTIMGVGLVEPLFDTVLLKMEAEEALGKGLKRVGQPLLVATLGLPEIHEPKPKEIKGFSDSVMANVGEMKDITLPYYYKLGKLEVNIGQLKEYLDHFSYLIASGLGIPHSILLAGERIGSKVADIQADNVVRIIKSYQKNLARTVEREIFKPLIKEAGLKEVPKLVFKTVSPALLRARMERIADASRAGLITPDKNLEEFIRKEEDLPPIGEESEEKSKLREQFRQKKFSDSKGAARKPKEDDGNT